MIRFIMVFIHLAPKQRLTNTVVNATIACLIKHLIKTHCAALPLLQTLWRDLVTIYISSSRAQLIVPYLQGDHYTLGLADFESYSFYFFDSLWLSRGFKRYEEFKTTLPSGSHNWSLINVNSLDRQNDIVSCGVFLLQYVECFLTSADVTKLKSEKEYRKTIRALLSHYGWMDRNNDANLPSCSTCTRSV